MCSCAVCSSDGWTCLPLTHSPTHRVFLVPEISSLRTPTVVHTPANHPSNQTCISLGLASLAHLHPSRTCISLAPSLSRCRGRCCNLYPALGREILSTPCHAHTPGSSPGALCPEASGPLISLVRHQQCVSDSGGGGRARWCWLWCRRWHHILPPPGNINMGLNSASHLPLPFPLLILLKPPPSVRSPIHTLTSIRPPAHPLVHPSVHPSIRSSIHPPIRSSIHPFAHPSVRPSVRPSIRSPTHPFVHPSA